MDNQLIAEYFGKYLDIDLTNSASSVALAVTHRRNAPERGWGYTIPVWIFKLGDRIVISTCEMQAACATNMVPQLCTITSQSLPISELLNLIHHHFPQLRRRHDFVYTCITASLRPFNSSAVRMLTAADIAAFISLSKILYPKIDIACETADITRNITDGIAFGAFAESMMVTRSYAPHIAHLQDSVEELGIDTLDQFRGRGYGKAALFETTRAVLDLHRVPIYRTAAGNLAAQRIAEAVGYSKFADSIELL
jgi:hypothetical protein